MRNKFTYMNLDDTRELTGWIEVLSREEKQAKMDELYYDGYDMYMRLMSSTHKVTVDGVGDVYYGSLLECQKWAEVAQS